MLWGLLARTKSVLVGRQRVVPKEMLSGETKDWTKECHFSFPTMVSNPGFDKILRKRKYLESSKAKLPNLHKCSFCTFIAVLLAFKNATGL